VTKSADGVPLITPVDVSKDRPGGKVSLMLHVSVAPPAEDAALMDGLLVTLCPMVNVIVSTVPLVPVYFKPEGATAFTVMNTEYDAAPPVFAAVNLYSFLGVT
jgi:hypothetical protein